MRTPNYELEKIVMSMINQGIKYDDIAKKADISKRYVYNILKKYKPVKDEEKKSEKKCVNFIEILNLHLVYNCNDFMLLNAMFKENVKKFTNKKIVIPDRLKKIGLEKKIERILNNG